MLNDEEAWKRLPRAERGGGKPLPAWARTLADALPRTTAAMLELDYRHRALSPLDARLRAKVRWTAAHANRCAYTEAEALADLERAGAFAAERAALIDGDSDAPEAEKAALLFARKMTLAADTVTDDEVKDLRRLYGDDKVVALVLLLAYSNFEDRLILSLGVDHDAGGPTASAGCVFRQGRPGAVGPAAQARRGGARRGRGNDSRRRRLEEAGLRRSAKTHGRSARAGAAHRRAGLGRRQETAAGRLPRAGPSGAHPLEPGVHGLPAGTGRGLVGLHARLRRGGEAGPRLRGEPVLGGDAVVAVLLLNGPL